MVVIHPFDLSRFVSCRTGSTPPQAQIEGHLGPGTMCLTPITKYLVPGMKCYVLRIKILTTRPKILNGAIKCLTTRVEILPPGMKRRSKI